jgi:Zn finger protein HypA/HybF involved in hydrogenase expression
MIEVSRDRGSTLVDLIDRVLDKGLVINADITVSVAGVELLGIKLRAALASFETAAKYGLEFPSGINMEASGFREAQVPYETCPNCGKRVEKEQLLYEGCPWCGWRSALSEGRVSYLTKQRIVAKAKD